MKIVISADTSCLINDSILKKNNIKSIPLNVIVDEVEYLDGVSINHEDLNKYMTSNSVIKTSTPPPGIIKRYFQDIFNEGYDYIIHFTISSKLSSMYNLFCTVAEEYFPGKIKVIDSYSGSALMLSHVLYAKDEIEKGIDVESICQEIERRKEDNFIWLLPKNLTTLKKGGRVSPTIAAIGNMLGLKPVLSFKDGQLGKDSMTRSMKKTFIEKIDSIYSTHPVELYDYTIISFYGEQNVVKMVKEHINKYAPEYKVIEGSIPINICAHCGPGSIGLLVTPKINGKSINDFI